MVTVGGITVPYIPTSEVQRMLTQNPVMVRSIKAARSSMPENLPSQHSGAVYVRAEFTVWFGTSRCEQSSTSPVQLTRVPKTSRHSIL